MLFFLHKAYIKKGVKTTIARTLLKEQTIKATPFRVKTNRTYPRTNGVNFSSLALTREERFTSTKDEIVKTLQNNILMTQRIFTFN